MKVNKPIGSKERLKEMFERVNKLKLDETFDIPVVDDKEYLDKSGDKEAEKSQPNKYDGGVDYPANDDLKTKDSSLNKITENEDKLMYVIIRDDYGSGHYVSFPKAMEKKYLHLLYHHFGTNSKYSEVENDGSLDFKSADEILASSESDIVRKSLDEISLSGIKGAGQYIGQELGGAAKGALDKVKTGITNKVDNIQKAYQRSAGNTQLNKLQKVAQDFGEKLGKFLAKYNERATKAGQSEITSRQIGMVILNAIDRAQKQGGGTNIDLSRFQMMKEHEWLGDEIPENMPPIDWIRKNYTMDYAVDGERFYDNKTGEEISPEDIAANYYAAKSLGLNEEGEEEINRPEQPESEVNTPEMDLSDIMIDDKDPNEFDARQILKGIEVEMEHTSDPRQAVEIAMDHLTEIPDYYDRLEDTEGEEDVVDIEDNSDASADALLDPSSHWIDHYSPKKLGDEMDGEEKKKIGEEESYDERMLKRYENILQQVAPNWDRSQNKLSAPKGHQIELKNVDPSDENLWGERLPSHDNADASIIMISPVHIYDWKQEFIEKFGDEGVLVKGLSLPQNYDLDGNQKYDEWKSKGIAGKSSFLDKERAAGRTSGLDEDDAKTINFNYDNKGNWLPQGLEDKRIGIRKVEQPLGSDVEKYLIVQIDSNGGVENILDTKDTWEDAVADIYDSIT